MLTSPLMFLSSMFCPMLVSVEPMTAKIDLGSLSIISTLSIAMQEPFRFK